MEKKELGFLTDNEGNPSSLRKVFMQFFWFTISLTALMVLGEMWSSIEQGIPYRANIFLVLLLFCMLFFPKLVQKVIEMKFPGTKDQIERVVRKYPEQ